MILIWAVSASAAAAVSIAALIAVYKNTSKILSKIDNMLEKAIDGKFSPQSFSEEKLSRIEFKMHRYLTQGSTSAERINFEKDNIKTLISDISHQTKTPIANIMLYSELLKEQAETIAECQKDAGYTEKSSVNIPKIPPAVEAARLAGEITEQSEKLNFLISALIKMSRLENGIINAAPKLESVYRLINSSGGAAEAHVKGVSFIIDTKTINTENDIYAYFDMKWTAEALSNIIENAVKYTPAGGSVVVSVKEYEMFACINVSDTGIGICEEETAKIFGRFYRSPDVYGEKGVGIGLYLAREIISKQHGYIKVSSQKGKGSVFSIYLSKNLNEIPNNE